MSSGVRGKKTIAPTKSTLSALDHDMHQKGSLVPSVVMLCDIPESVEDSFYSGLVNIALKDAVFQPSDSFRTVLEMKKVVEERVDSIDDVKYLFLMTDGGGEHRVNFHSVKVPLILLFKELDLDLLVAIRCAPGQSYISVVERIMSILNIGIQNVALERAVSPSDSTIQKARNMAELRTHPEVKGDWLKSLEPMQEEIRGRFERLKLKDDPFKVRNTES